ncbi:MAG TPA: ABC transporter ATP-binding protein/permease [Candidatus Borkfalkia faecipullorum]|uniref:ABC transporter ATP-binding protein/permease n=1 Tax=Candidatus Borkfalkia faecipullorum TaxID=2838510 RepID=A0A9D1V7L8_9FIRM|nr:ABC transporter ATP-binding protein/permease [Candidatus Borkfalkia faecipullorum]
MNKPGKKAAFFRLLKYFSQYKRLVAAALFFAVVGNVLALVAPVLSANAINAIDTKSGVVDMDAVLFYCIAMAVCYVLSSAFTYALTFTMTKLSRNISRKMREEVFDKLLSLPVSFFDKRLAGDVINRLIYDIDTVNASLSNDIVQISTGVITIVGSLVSMLLLSPLLSCVFVVIIPLTVLVTVQRSRVMRPLFRKRSGKLGELNGYSEEMLSGIRTIKGYGREEEISARYEERNRIAAGAYYDADYYGSKVGPTVNFINNLSTVFISVLGGWLFLQGKMQLGYVSAFLQYSRKFTGPINEFANIISEIQSALAAAERLFGVLDETPEQDAPQTLPAPQGVHGRVEFSNVTFGYEPEKPILKGVSFSAKAGSTVAIVGPTGAGKTTIVNLLMRFYDADKGEILLDGVETRRYTRSDLRAQFTMVLQDTWLFEGTVRENIAYGADGVTQEEIERAARAAGVHDFILSLPQGYDTRITDGGSSLSKGQKQLLTIARAMVSRARILILDEATSNVDTRTEILVQAATQKLMQGKTCFVIAHRLSTIVGADLILVVRGGNIVESGTHTSLLEQGGFYASLYGAQFQ